MKLFDLTGKVAIVTGGNGGIGLGMARGLAQAGAAVAVAGRQAGKSASAVKELEALGARAMAVEVDVRKEASCRAMVQAVAERLGRVDILVNNAGVMLLGPVIGADTSEWRRMVEVNMLGLLYCTHAVLPIMGEQGSGHIVNVSSVAGRHANFGSAVYNLTKFGVNGFSEALRQELTPANVRVTVIEPGFVATELQSHNTHPMVLEAMERMREEIGEPLEPEDIAEAILYAVASPRRVSVNEVMVRPTGQRR